MSGESSSEGSPTASDVPTPKLRKIQRGCWWTMLVTGTILVIVAISTNRTVLGVANTIIAMGGLTQLIYDRRRG